MERLPNELLQDVFGYCSIADACNARLAGKELAKACAQFVFTHYHLHFHPSGLAELWTIVRAGHGKHIKSILVDNQQSRQPSSTTVKQHVDYWATRYPDLELELADLLARRRHRRLSKMVRRVKEEETTAMRELSHRLVLRRAFAALHALRKVVIVDYNVSGLWSSLHDLRGRADPLPVELGLLVQNGGRWPDRTSDYILTAVLDAIAQRADMQPTSHVVDLAIYGGPREKILTQDTVSPGTEDFDSRYTSIMKAMQCIESLRVCIVADPNLDKATEDSQDHDMIALLENCHRLSHLQIFRNDWGPQRAATVAQSRNKYLPTKIFMLESLVTPLAPLFNALSPVWPRLESLKLTRVNFWSDDLLLFLRNHDKTLKNLAISWCCTDNVQNVFVQIPKVLKLKSAMWEHLFQWSEQNLVALHFCSNPYRKESTLEHSWLLGNESDPPLLTSEHYADNSLFADFSRRLFMARRHYAEEN